MAHTKGAQMWLQHLRIIEKDDVSGDTSTTSTRAVKRRCMAKQSSKLQQAEPFSAAGLRIGQQGRQFAVCAHEDVWSQIVAVANKTKPIKLPESCPIAHQYGTVHCRHQGLVGRIPTVHAPKRAG